MFFLADIDFGEEGWKRLKYFHFGAEQAEVFKEMFHPAIIPTSVLITPVFI